MKNHQCISTSTVFFNNLSFDEAVTEVKALSQGEAFSYVVTPNIDHLQRLCSGVEKQELLPIYESASLSLCDSRILDKMLAFKGKKPKAVIPGSTLSQYLFDHVLTKDDRILVIGIESIYIEQLRAVYAHLSISHINPSMGFINRPDEVANLIDEIKKVNAHYVFLSVGSPRQEILAYKLAHAEGIGGVGLCVGASVLFMVGAEKRAPLFIQRLHMEWAYRILQDPKRLAMRYLKNFLSLPAIMKSL